MLSILLLFFLYVMLTVVSSQFLLSLSAPIFLILVYLLPILLNMIGIKYQKNKNLRLICTGIFPLFSMLYYLLFAYLTASSGTWSAFIQMNSVSDSQMTVDIAENLMSGSQLLFAGLVYFTTATVYSLLSKRNYK